MVTPPALLQDRLLKVEDRIAAACRRAGRRRDGVTLVAVTKNVSVQTAQCLPGLGLIELGESRPQELWHKAPHLPGSVGWHLIGHLQRNKIPRTLPLVKLIHSVDSVRLLQALDQEAQRQERTVQVLLEVNAAAETSKQGFTPAQVADLAGNLTGLAQIQVVGLMTMAPWQDPEACRPIFSRLRDLRAQLQAKLGPPHRLLHLSMGMSNDFEVAIEEGATLVRLGTVLFEGLS